MPIYLVSLDWLETEEILVPWGSITKAVVRAIDSQEALEIYSKPGQKWEVELVCPEGETEEILSCSPE